MTQHLPVFVYGTLRSNQGNYSWALANTTVHEETAHLNGVLMHCQPGSFPFVTTIGAGPDDTVVGDLMHIHPDVFTDTLSALDGLEGYHGPDYPGNMYDRTIVTVTTIDGTPIQAYTYLVAPGMYSHRVKHLPLVPSGDWLDTRRTPAYAREGNRGW